MRNKFLSVAMTLLFVVGFSASAAPDLRTRQFNQAVKLYAGGLYQEAKALLEQVNLSSPDALSMGYDVLCAIRMHTEGYENAIASYEKSYLRTPLYPQIHFLYGLNLFDEERYQEAADEFAKVRVRNLFKSQESEFLFKQAYCDFGQENYQEAERKFIRVEGMAFSDYTAPTRYALGYISYNRNDFDSAIQWFEKSAKDPRFELSSLYYLLECKFMNKDYSYVVEKGEDIYRQVSEERQPHLARILSESFLVLGNTGKAKEYYDKDVLSKTVMNRSDYFYAGSLQYALGNFQDAITNFTMMPMRTDSLGQIANYQLGYSYIQVKNKVSALESFSQAAGLSYSAEIQEDAYFNYAKLAFDLNHDASVFEDYLKVYSDSKRGDLIYSYLATAYLVNRDYASAVRAYDNIDELNGEMRSNYMKANFLRAQQLIESGSYRDAVECLRASTFFTDKTNNFNKLARYWLAEAYYKSDRYSEAAAIYQDLYNLSALDHQQEGKALPYNLAYCYFKQGNYKSASRWFDQYINSRHMTWREDAAIRRADCDFLQKDYVSAVDNYQKVIDEFGFAGNIYPSYQLGLSYGLSGKNSKKIAALSKITELSSSKPFYSDAVYELGRAYVSEKKTSEAVSCFENLVRTSRDSTFIAKSLIELGMIYRNKSELDKSLSYYKTVVEKMPGSECYDDALLAIESIYQKRGETEKYLEYVEQIGNPVRKSEHEKELMYFNSAEQIFLSENYQKALVSLNKYVSMYPKGEKVLLAYYYMADCYKGLGEKEKACDYYSKVVDMSDDGSYTELAMLNFAQLSYSLGHYSDAYGAYSSLLDAARLENNKYTAELGMMRSAYNARNYAAAIKSADLVSKDNRADADVLREADFTKAMSYLATSQRDNAFVILRRLARTPSTDEGAQACYLIIQDTYDQGLFSQIEDLVYDFSDKASGQSYWLAKAYIVLGDSFVENDNLRQARATYESLLEGYEPYGKDDDVLDNVKMRISKLNQIKD